MPKFLRDYPITSLFLVLLLVASSCRPDDDADIVETNCSNDNSLSFTEIGCDTAPTETSLYEESIIGGKRSMDVNGYPNHHYHAKSAVHPINTTYTVDPTPTKVTNVTSLLSDTNHPRRFFGVALNGVILAPAPATPFIFKNTATGEYNWDWVFEPTNNKGDGMSYVALDCSSAHIGPQGYHYHGTMFEYAETLQEGLSMGIAPGAPIQMGWASDGFPILYLYGPDEAGNLKALQPSYQLKNGDRPGDGISAPCDVYNGKYTNDYEFVMGTGDLDECNGVERNITLSTAQGEETFSYFYVITESFPQVGRCLVGPPDQSFNN